MADFYEAYHSQLSQGRRREEIIDELEESIAPETEERQSEIERWAMGEGETRGLDQIDLEAFGKMFEQGGVGG